MPVKILVVDDEPDLELLMKQRFRKKIRDNEWNFEFALNGREALNKLNSNSEIGLVLTDINMPEMDGLTLLQKIQELNRTLKTVVISAYGDMQNIRVAMNRGAFDFITKPVNFEDLEITIEKSLKEVEIISKGVIAQNELLVALREKTLAEREKDFAIIEKHRAEQSEKFKQQFLANMSHEIRTPMNAVMGMANLLSKSTLDKQQSTYLSAIRKSSENLLVIINDILDLSKIQAGKMEFEQIDFEMEDILNTVYNTMRFNAEEKNILLKTEINNNVPALVKGDSVRLIQILINLAGNAIKFTEAGEVKISVLCLPLSKTETIILEFSVSDTGIGIAKEKLGNIFESFTQASSDTTRKYGGTGLGLTISKQLVELQSGEIFVDSELGKGTVFSFQIPYQKADSTHQKTTRNRTDIDLSKLNQLKLLLVEDNHFNQMVAIDILRTEAPGVRIVAVGNGREAIEKLAEETFDVVLMDVQMPEMDGYEATRYIRMNLKERSSIPILAMTASATKTEIDLCLDCGMNDFISKPFIPEELFRKIVTLATR